MNIKINLLLIALIGIHVQTTLAQGVITIDYKTQRFLDDISTLDRSKYTNGHINFKDKNDAAFNTFKSDYHIHTDYVGGRSFWNPASKVKNGVIPKVKNTYTGIREVYPWYVAGGKENNLFWNAEVGYAEADISEWSKELANYVAQSLKSDWEWTVKYLEPLNEPMVHAKDYYPGSSADKTDKVITKICEYHRDLGQSVHAVPELKNIMVMGYASAWPEFERDDFDVWKKRYKKFIDIAGEDIDVFSLHLYDSSDGTKRRSGANSEALLDIIEAYSFKKLGLVKPIAITEFGRLVPNQNGWENGNGVNNYDPITNSQAVRSQLHLIMNFMEHANNLAIAIPFNTNQRNTTTQFSKSTIWLKNEEGKIERSMRKYTYEMLKDLKGERVRIKSSIVDVQTQAFVDGNQLYVMLNNLNETPQTVDLNMHDTQSLKDVDIKSLKIFDDKTPELSQSTVSIAPQSLTLDYGETVVLTYNFDAPIVFENKIVSKKYYTNDFMKNITANAFNDFTFNNVEIGFGEATVQLGVARVHGLSLKPTVKVNGTEIEIPKDVIRGYDQKDRSQFYGVLEIPVKMEYLNIGENTISVKFPDAGGQIASAILKVQKADHALPTSIRNITKETDIFHLYPTIANAKQAVQIRCNKKTVNYRMYNGFGAEIKSGLGKQISTNNLNSGIYIVKIQSGNYFESKKLIIK